MAGLDQLPHPPADLVADPHDLPQRRIVDLIQGSPHRRDRRHLPEQSALIAQHRGPGQVLRPARDRHRHVPQHRAPIVEDLRPRQHRRQAAGQTGRISQHARDYVTGVPDHIVATDLDSKTFGPIRSSLHLTGALPPWTSEH